MSTGCPLPGVQAEEPRRNSRHPLQLASLGALRTRSSATQSGLGRASRRRSANAVDHQRSLRTVKRMIPASMCLLVRRTRRLPKGIATNSMHNFLGLGIQLSVGLLALPALVRVLEPQKFGALSLVWATLGYFSLFDLGVGRATTRFVAADLGAQKRISAASLVWTAITAQLLISTLISSSLYCGRNWILSHFHGLPDNELQNIFWALLLTVPAALISSSLCGVLEAMQRFDLSNSIRVPTNSSIYLVPLAFALCGRSLVSMVWALVAVRYITVSVALAVCLTQLPELATARPSAARAGSLAKYSGWVTVSALIAPTILYSDRYLIASLANIEVLAFYTAPFEMVTRLSAIPLSVAVATFPVISGLPANANIKELKQVVAKPLRYVLILQTALVFVIIANARTILSLWLGPAFADRSSLVLQILCLGSVAQAAAYLPHAALQGVGRPDIVAKFHIWELLSYFALATFLIDKRGTLGAATAFTIRATADAVLLHITWSRYHTTPQAAPSIRKRPFAPSAAMLLTIGMAFAIANETGPLLRAMSTAVVLAIFLVLAWRAVLTEHDRIAMTSWLRMVFACSRTAA